MRLTCETCRAGLDVPDGAPGPAYACPACGGPVPVPGRGLGEVRPPAPADPLAWAWGALAVLAALGLPVAAAVALTARSDAAAVTAPLWLLAFLGAGAVACHALARALGR
jgi:hypothetical protein